jgi:hypothetical protein
MVKEKVSMLFTIMSILLILSQVSENLHYLTG